jgi:hypothetical protein
MDRLLHVLQSGRVVVPLAAVAGLTWSWGAWPDPVIDFGRELYVPWRLSQGEVLYRDIVSFNGPFSHYLLAGWFAITGPSLLALVGLNVAILGATLALAHAMLSRVASVGAATVSCLTFLGVFAFGHLAPSHMEPMGNFNWITPYSHELTHGIALALLALYCVFRFCSSSRAIWAAAAGLALGGVFLTKAEVFAAAAIASGAGLAGSLWLERAPLKRSLEVLGAWTLCAVLPALASACLLATAMPARAALLGTLGTWPHLLETTHTELPYFGWGLGTDDLPASFARILGWLGIYAAAFAAMAAVARRGCGAARAPIVVAGALAGSTVAIAWLAGGWIAWFDGEVLQWNDVAQPWQLLLLLVLAGCARPVLRRSVEPAKRPVAVLRIALVTFSLALLAKMFFNVRVYHYGFALAAPAAWIIVALFWSWLPDWMDRRYGNGALLRGAFLSVWCVTMAAHIAHANANIETKVHVVGAGSDSFRAPARGEIFAEALDYLEQHAKPGETLAALPEGAMLNYLTRKVTPTPFLQYTPPLIILFGEDEMLESLRNDPPHWIALIHRNDQDYGKPFFGRDYGSKLREWIARHYLQVKRCGAPPFRHSGFGIVIMKRRA